MAATEPMRRLTAIVAAGIAGYSRLTATAMARDVLGKQPGFNLSEWKVLQGYKLPADRRRLIEAAKRAGIPEFPPRR